MERILSMSRGFAVFGFFFSIFECQLERLRKRDDAWNSFYSGAFTSMILAFGNVGFKGLMFSGFGAGMFGLIMYNMNIFGH